ncbi:hypothetical protein [Desulfatibacillum aliphaticivorans]|uniref:hypothetical protein n=1 Tax=Desulfatibacillum aliphaticivorans TaxID=218208 RepID=UPI000484D041|nr:hypothetical protein [Desulfatibacillum aliphaticivorans]
MARSITPTSSYSDVLIQLIPAEMVSAYIAIQEMAIDCPRHKDVVLLGSALILLIALPFYLFKIQGVVSKRQIVVTMVSFVIWVFSVGGRFIDPISTDPIWRAAALILWTTFAPMFYVQTGQDAND